MSGESSSSTSGAVVVQSATGGDEEGGSGLISVQTGAAVKRTGNVAVTNRRRWHCWCIETRVGESATSTGGDIGVEAGSSGAAAGGSVDITSGDGPILGSGGVATLVHTPTRLQLVTAAMVRSSAAAELRLWFTRRRAYNW
jgi:hypothetical protein